MANGLPMLIPKWILNKLKKHDDDITELNNDLDGLLFKNNSGTGQYSLDNGSTWVNFKNPTGNKDITVTSTSTSGIDVTDYATASVTVSATNVSPSSSGTYFSSGLINMSSSGYAYSSRPSSISFGSFITSTNGSLSLNSSHYYAVSIALYHTSSTTPSCNGTIDYQQNINSSNCRGYLLIVHNATTLSITGNYKCMLAIPIT